MLYNGSFNDIDPPLLAAFLSCFLSGESSKKESKAPKNPILAQLFERVTESAKKMADVLIECKINLVKTDYVESFKPDLMEVVLDWANGAKFIDICQNTDVYEGILIYLLI